MHITIVDDKIIYERKLKEGQGSSVYGIEVCKSLNLPLEFMKNAELIKKEIQGIDNLIINNVDSYVIVKNFSYSESKGIQFVIDSFGGLDEPIATSNPSVSDDTNDEASE
jgi:DNA mismatch repair ATPase MutS